MSGGSEANFELGYAVNVDSHLNLLKATHAHATATKQKPLYVFVSSLAVYGGPKCTPSDRVIPEYVLFIDVKGEERYTGLTEQ